MKKIITTVLLWAVVMFTAAAQAPKFITVKGKEIIGADGKPFLIRGTNLGNWLVPEGYMFKFKAVNSQRLINEALTELVGPEEMKLFWRAYQDTYITEADIKFLKASGMTLSASRSTISFLRMKITWARTTPTAVSSCWIGLSAGAKKPTCM